MENNYPTNKELRMIKTWDYKKGFIELAKYVASLWSYPDRVRFYYSKDFRGSRIKKLYLSTGGWSGNESIIFALQQNHIFWIFCWQKSIRGGHYWFIFPKIKKPPTAEGAEEKERRMMREIDGKELFSIDDRGFNIKAWYLKDTETEQGDALIRITRKDGLFKEAVYPAYKIYNIAAHSDDIITSEINGDQRGYLIAGLTGLGGYIMPKPIAKAEGAK